MQTFLPYPDFEQSARVLDWRRLNKQRSETKQILLALTGRSKAWRHHPATRMWEDYETSLAYYGWEMCREWLYRGGQDNVGLIDWFADQVPSSDYPPPIWLGNEHLHHSHRSNLMRKDWEFYGPLWSGDSHIGMPYLWPLKDGDWREWSLYLSVSESRRTGWTLPESLVYEPSTRRIRG